MANLCEFRVKESKANRPEVFPAQYFWTLFSGQVQFLPIIWIVWRTAAGFNLEKINEKIEKSLPETGEKAK